MDPQHVRYFLAVVDHGSVNAAANALGVAQPTISQAMRSLERELRTRLFHRIGRGMVPTSAGHALVGPARTILRDIATAASSVPDSDGLLHGRVDIRAHPSVATGLLARVIAEFQRRQPRAKVTVAPMYDESQAAVLLRDAVCELVVAHFPLEDDAGADEGGVDGEPLETLELGTQVYDLALPPNEDDASTGTLRWDALDEALVVVPQGGLHAERLFRAMSPAQRGHAPAVILQNREARLAFALAGAGATWIERSATDSALARGARVRVMEPTIPAHYGLGYLPGSLSTAARAFVEVAASLAEAPAPEGGASAEPRNASAAGES